MMETKNSLRSSVWSSETLAAGAVAVTAQPNGLLMKAEEDEELLAEYAVSWLEVIN